MIPLLAATENGMESLFAVFAVLLLFSVVVSLVLVKARQSLLVGYFICGVVLANSGLIDRILIHSDSANVIHQLADIGVILLMFTLGIEFPLKEVKYIWRSSIFGGLIQMGLCSLVLFGVAYAFALPMSIAIVIGIAMALSSTAVSLKSFQDLGMSNHPSARFSLSIALFQDVFVILVILLLPSLLGQQSQGLGQAILLALGKGIVFILVSWLLGIYVIPRLLDAVAKTRSRELFTLMVIGLCVSIAYVGYAMHLGLALGAFAAGLIVSNSIYSHRILSEILPFKDLLLTVFFVSVGLQIKLEVAGEHWMLILGLVVVVLVVKSLVVFLSGKVLGLPTAAAMMAAAALASSGEFSIILLSQAGKLTDLSGELIQILLISTAIGMGAVPSLMRLAPKLKKFLVSKGIIQGYQKGSGHFTATGAIHDLEDHAVIFGYGPVGQSLNEALKLSGIRTLVVDLNASTVRDLTSKNQPALFADASHQEIIELANVESARLLAYTFPDVEVTKHSLKLVRLHHPEVPVFARAKFTAEVEELEKLGVQTIHDERESGDAMVNLALSAYSSDETRTSATVI